MIFTAVFVRPRPGSAFHVCRGDGIRASVAGSAEKCVRHVLNGADDDSPGRYRVGWSRPLGLNSGDTRGEHVPTGFRKRHEMTVDIATRTDQQAGEPLVSARGLGVFRSGRWLVRGVDLSIGRGEIVTLIGPNGGGKSTIAKAILGLIKADEGSVHRPSSLRIGYVPQKLSIDQTLPMTVRRMMALTERHSGNAIKAALAEVGSDHLIDAPVQMLSGGEFQRVLLARAFVRDPDLLVLDEPVQGVDHAGEVRLYELIEKVRQRIGCGVLLISHDLHVVMARTDQVYCVNGHVCCSGSPQLVGASAQYRELFGEKAAEALAVYHHDHDHSHEPDGSVHPHHHSN